MRRRPWCGVVGGSLTGTWALLLAGLFAGVVQYNGDNRAFEGATNTNITIDVVCDTLTKSGSDPLTQWAAVNQMLSGTQCTSFNYSEMIMAMRDTSLTAPAAEGGRQWTYVAGCGARLCRGTAPLLGLCGRASSLRRCTLSLFAGTKRVPSSGSTRPPTAPCSRSATTSPSPSPSNSALPLLAPVSWRWPHHHSTACAVLRGRCEDIFGSMFDQTFIQGRVNFTLEHYGGRDLLGTK